jgi:hypothetical protein
MIVKLLCSMRGRRNGKGRELRSEGPGAGPLWGCLDGIQRRKDWILGSKKEESVWTPLLLAL